MARITIDMIEVTRLTRQGRLEDAMAALRGERPGLSATTLDHPASMLRPDREAPGIRGVIPTQQSLRTLLRRANLQLPLGSRARWNALCCERRSPFRTVRGSRTASLSTGPGVEPTSSTFQAATTVSSCR